MSGAPPPAPDPPARPLDAASFAAAMAALGPFEDRPALAVAVSGGPDSMALALLLRDWVAAHAGSLLALVVDHRLRPGSSEEALWVRRRLEALGIEAEVRTRPGELPASALQERARQARYALLQEAAAGRGLLHLAVAHHAMDQAETVAMRRASGSGHRGEAGMSAVRFFDRVRLLRPLLAFDPRALRALLRAAGVPWLEDPSNRDPRFWRARHRRGETRTTGDLRELQRRAALARQLQDRRLASVLAALARPHPAGFVEVDRPPLAQLADADLEDLLGRLITAVGGAVWPPARAKLARLAGQLGAGRQGKVALGGVLIEAKDAELRFCREPRAVAGPVALAASRPLVWDGRFRIRVGGCDAGLRVEAAGPGWRQRSGLDLVARLPAVAVRTLPLISDRDGPWMIGPWPLRHDRQGSDPLIEVTFRPQHLAAPPPFLGSMIGSVA